MLSYQHGYHAGNMADVHKHALLAWMLSYLMRKDKPLSYLETHAGRALYDLTDEAALKTGEAARGIAIAEDWFDADHPYRTVLNRTRADAGPQAYPGSPLIAAQLLRDCDQIDVAELHPGEMDYLRDALIRYPAGCHQLDGWQMAMSRCPPDPRRGMLLVDPSFEVKADYGHDPRFLCQNSPQMAGGDPCAVVPDFGRRPALADDACLAKGDPGRNPARGPLSPRPRGTRHGRIGHVRRECPLRV
jgi:23S rRNA (adenine2030-N6)-methyltransferase